MPALYYYFLFLSPLPFPVSPIFCLLSLFLSSLSLPLSDLSFHHFAFTLFFFPFFSSYLFGVTRMVCISRLERHQKDAKRCDGLSTLASGRRKLGC